jgi:hypothetical protein
LSVNPSPSSSTILSQISLLGVEASSVLPSVESSSNRLDANPFCGRKEGMLLIKSNKARSKPKADLYPCRPVFQLNNTKRKLCLL